MEFLDGYSKQSKEYLEHLRYINQGNFKIESFFSKTLKDREVEILEKYGHWFQALSDDVIIPITKDQMVFLDEVRSKDIEVSIHAKIWRIYMYRKSHEAELHKEYHADQNPLWTDEDYQAYKKMMGKVVWEGHSK